jgi:hypothetical protein
MPTDEVQRYAGVYDGQELATNQTDSIFAGGVEIAAPFMLEGDDPPSAAEIQDAMHSTAVTYSRLHALSQISQQLDQNFVDTLKKN